MYKLYSYLIIFLLLIPGFAFSQLDGGFIDNTSSDMISRLSIKDKPVSDIIEYNEGLIIYTDDSLFFYNVVQEEAQALIEVGDADAKFVDLKLNATTTTSSSSYLFFNTFDAFGNFQSAKAYNLSENTITDLGSVILKDVYLVGGEIYFVGLDPSLGELGLYYQDASGPLDGLSFTGNYQVEVTTDGFLWIIAQNLLQVDVILYYVDTQAEPAKLNNFAQPNDISFSLINDNIYYSSQDKLIRVAQDRNKTELSTIRGEKFFKLGSDYVGFYEPDILGDNDDIKIINTADVVSPLGDFFSLGSFLGSDLQSVLQLSDHHVALVNVNNEVMIINSSLEFVNQGNLFSFTNPPLYGEVFNQRFLSLYSSETLLSSKSDELLYYDLDTDQILVDKDFADYDDLGYNFRPQFAATTDHNFAVAFSSPNGFELNLLSETNGFQIAEEITNDAFSQNFLSEKGVGQVREEYSTYPKKLISLNNTLYYLAHLASGGFEGYYFLYKVNKYPTDITLSNNSVSESISSPTMVASISSTDFDDGEFTYTLDSGFGDNNLFTISGDELTTSGGFDYETKSSLSIRIQTEDPHGLTYQEDFTITVEDANDTPSDITLTGNSILEGQPEGTKIADLSTQDQDINDTFIYTLTNSASNSFLISGDELLSNEVFDYGSQQSYTISIQTEDDAGAVFEKDFTVTILENLQPDDINLSANSIPENNATDDIVGILSATDPNDSGNNFNYSLVTGDGDQDNGSFSIDNSADPAVLKTAAVLDYEVKNSLAIRIGVTDQGGNTFEKNFDIAVIDLNDAPDSMVFKLQGNQFTSKAAEEIITEIEIRDQDLGAQLTDTYNSNYSISFSQLTGNNGSDNFYLSYESEVYVLRALNAIEYDPDNPESNIFIFELQLEDDNHSSGEIKYYKKEFSLEVVNNDGPAAPQGIVLSNDKMNENIEENPNGLIVGELSTTDFSNGSHSYAIVDTENGESLDNSLFEIVESNQLALKSFDNISYDNDSLYQVNIRSTNSETNLFTTEQFSIVIEEYIDEEEPIIESFSTINNAISVSGNENIKLDMRITDWELDTVIYQYGGIIQENFVGQKGDNYQDGQQEVEIPFPKDQLDAFGLKLQIIASDKSGNADSSDIFYFYRDLPTGNLYSNLPENRIGKGRLSTDYRMFSVPYEMDNKEIRSFLEQELGVVYSPNDFRILRWNSQEQEYDGIPRLVNFKPGESYWFTTTLEKPEINFGSGKLYPYKENQPFMWNLKKGWNQIGNPYPVTIDWADITKGTPLEGSKLHIYDSVYEASDSLEPYQGAFVLAQEDVRLESSLNNLNSNQRMIKKMPFSWKVDFEVEQNEFLNTGRIGMHPQAFFSLDKFDLANPPPFAEHLEIDLNKADRFYSNYKSDIVSNEKEYEWDLTINSHQQGVPITLRWKFEGILPGQLFLIEMNSLRMVDMALENEYYFAFEGKPEFKIFYSEYEARTINLGILRAGKPYPNPMTDQTTIGFNLPDSRSHFTVSAQIMNLEGKMVQQLQTDKYYDSGYHRVHWNGIDDEGNEVASGIYLYRLTVAGDETDVFTGRILKLN